MTSARVRLLSVLGLVAVGLALFALHSPNDGYASPKPHHVFRDCAACPEMVVIEPGSFEMGFELRRRDLAMEWLGLVKFPRHPVAIPRPFAMGTHEVTFDEWAACVAGGGCGGYRPQDMGWGRGSRPVINVSWDNAQDYVRWLSKQTGARYRLLTEAEWEYAARAGTKTFFPWGRRADHAWANYGADECCKAAVSGHDQWLYTAPVGSFPANPLGLYDMMGNVYEWVEDCYEPTVEHTPNDGSAFETPGCKRRVMRGGAWINDPGRMRSAYRSCNPPDHRDYETGFRVAKTLD